MFLRNNVFEIFEFTQKINHPHSSGNENFGRAIVFDKYKDNVTLDSGTRNLVISSDKASTILPMGFDIETNSNKQDYLQSTTRFDNGGTTFTDKRTQSGAAYVYEFLNANSPTITNPDKMVFAQQLTLSLIHI